MNSYKVKWRGQEVSEEVRDSAVKGLRDAVEFLLDESNKIAPVDEGTLIGSGETDVDAKKLEASVFYDTRYAVIQHEDMTLKHINGRQAKYLETAWKNNLKRIQAFLARSIKL